MTIPSAGELLQFLISQGEVWVRAEQLRLRPTARMLSPEEIAQVGPFFPADVLRLVRTVELPVIPNPAFYSTLAQLGLSPPIDFQEMSGITFVDTIAFSRVRPPAAGTELRMLFHELVHVVQYRALGTGEFLRRYVTGWAQNGFQYAAIPLERWAYQLDARFAAKGPAFSVEEEVTAQLA
jgi:hypothetical protein